MHCLSRAFLLIFVIGVFVFINTTLAADSASVAAPKDHYDRSNVPIEVQPTDASAAKIVLIAGDAGTGHGPGEHEHFAGCALLMRMLQQTKGVAPVFVQNGWPTNPETLKNARTLVFYMDGGGKQTTIAHADDIQKMMDAGVGIVHLHQVIDYPTEPGKQAMQWLGGVYDAKAGGARGHWDESFDHFPDHPITRGVAPFTLNDGWILKLTFVPELKGITPLMRTTQLSPKGKPEKPITNTDNIVCWAYERPTGGRAFVLTGAHGHNNWGLPGLRRLVVNGILWSAKVEIPEGGAPVELDPADLMTNMDRKPAKATAGAAAAKTVAAPKTDAEAILGTWDLVSVERDGKALPKENIAQHMDFVAKQVYFFSGDKRENSAEYTIDSSKTPAQIELSPAEGDDKNHWLRGIYELEGDKLRLCLPNNVGDFRPTDFTSDATTAVFTLQRRADKK